MKYDVIVEKDAGHRRREIVIGSFETDETDEYELSLMKTGVYMDWDRANPGRPDQSSELTDYRPSSK